MIPRSLAWCAAAALTLGLAGAAGAGPEESGLVHWDPGHGVTVPRYGLWFAGDFTIDADVLEDEPNTIELDDVSLLARWDATDRLSFFTEVRLEDVVAFVDGEGATSGDWDLTVERLYAEALLTPTLTLRAGEFYTPYGLWNVVRRAPLTWTSDRPSITEDVFPQHATGLSLLYQTTWQGWSVDATGYGPAQDVLSARRRDDDELREDGLMFGGRVAVGHTIGPAFAALGLNALGYRPEDRSGWTTVTGADLDVTLGGHLVTGEFTFRISPSGRLTKQGLYLQDVIPLEPYVPVLRNLYGVLRFEQLQPGRGPGAVGGLVGLFWRPAPWLVLRGDYFWASRELDDFEPGFRSAISIMF
jgi:hypothetical protein